MANSLLNVAGKMADQLVSWRRHLHKHPELSGQEERTAAYIAGELREMGYEPDERVGGTHGVTATLPGDSRPAIALRADIDALPIQEQTGLDFASRNDGVMHACGHDSHTAMLLGAARLLRDSARPKRSIKFIFQPSEEKYPGGAAPLIKAGVLDGVEAVFGIHIASQLPPGVLGTRPGAMMSAVNDIHIVVRGKGGHAAMPEQCADPVVAAANVIVSLQTVTSRSIGLTDGAVVSITQVNAGTADNVIPEQVELRGTIRTLDEAVREKVCTRVRQIAEAVAVAHNTQADVNIAAGYPVLANDPEMVERARQAASAIGFDSARLVTIPPIGGGEDFAYYCLERPSVFVFLGAGNAEKACTFPHHHPRFNIDEDVLPSGAALHAQFALSFD